MGKPNINIFKDNSKAIHPKSRKAKKLNKQFNRTLKLQKRRSEGNVKLQFLGDKLLWFKENLDSTLDIYTPSDLLNLIERYIARNEEELEQIELKHTIGGRASHQHANRRDRIKITRENETALFNGAGFEIVNLLNPDVLSNFKLWTGEVRYLTNFKLRRFKKQTLEDGSVTSEDPKTSAVDESSSKDANDDSEEAMDDSDGNEDDTEA